MSALSPGVLVLHGFTGTPFEVSYLAKMLRRDGVLVSTPLLPGHGTTPRQLHRTTSRQWRGAVAAHLDALCAETGGPIAAVGQSMGGLLALDAASAAPDRVAAVVALAAPLWLPGAGRALTALGHLPRRLTAALPIIQKSGGGSDVRDPEIRRTNPAYPVLPLSGVVELTRLMRRVRRRLERVRCPVLVIHGRHDHTAPPGSAAEIIARVSSPDRRLVMLPDSYHLIAHDVERAAVARAVREFLARVLPGYKPDP